MTTSVIKQIVKKGEYGTQCIKIIVKSNERGPKGEDGAIQYKGGNAITIEGDTISADIVPGKFFTEPLDFFHYYDTYTDGNPLEIVQKIVSGPIVLSVRGNLEQQGTPTPDSPKPIKVASGLQHLDITLQEYYGTIENFDINLGDYELCRLSQSSCDAIVKKLDKWYLHKEVAKFSFDGSLDEEWELIDRSAQGRPNGFGISVSQKVDGPAFCDYFEYNPYVDWDRGQFYILQNEQDPTAPSQICFCPTDTSQTTVASWKAWLAEHPITVYCNKNLSSNEQITDATLIGQLEALKTARGAFSKTRVEAGLGNPAESSTNVPCTYGIGVYSCDLNSLMTDFSRKISMLGFANKTGGTVEPFFKDQRPYLVTDDHTKYGPDGASYAYEWDLLPEKGQLVYDTTDNAIYAVKSFTITPGEVADTVTIDWQKMATDAYVDERLGGLTILPITQTDYDNLQTYDANTLYVIIGE